MNSVELETLEVETSKPVTASVIWLHGLGADGHDFEPIVPELNLEGGPGIRFIFPHAPQQPVTINGNMVMRAWFDIKSLSRSDEDEIGIRRSQALVEGLIKRENERGIPSSRIVLAGFSQGGAIALQCGLRYGESLAGLLCLSCYLPLATSLEMERTDANKSIPIFLAHGEYDPVLPLAFGEETLKILNQLGYEPQWRAYPMPHSVCPQEIEHIGLWLKKML